MPEVTEAPTILVRAEKLNQDANAILVVANKLVVNSPSALVVAGRVLRDIKTSLRRVAEAFDESINAAHKAHKTVIEASNKHKKPRMEAKGIVDDKILDYQREQEKARRAEELRLQEVAQREAEDRQLADAEALAHRGAHDAAEALIDEPVVAAPVVLAKTTPKLEGISTSVTWKHRIVNPALIPRMYMMPDEKMIGVYARSMKKQANIAGVEFYPQESLRSKAY